MDELKELKIRLAEIETFKFEVIDCIAYRDIECEIDWDPSTKYDAKRVSMRLEKISDFIEKRILQLSSQ